MNQAKIASPAKFAPILLACALAGWTIVPVAHAEAPSVDAYAGQALVLGKPHKKTSQPAATDNKHSNEGSKAAGGAAAAATQHSSSSGSGGGSGPSLPSGAATNEGSHAEGSTRSEVKHRSAAGAGHRAGATGTGASRPATSQSPVTVLRPASSTLPLSGGDAALLVLALLLLAGTAFALRRTRPSA